MSEQAVIDFAAGLVSAPRLGDVERHLASCDHCAELVMLAAAPRVEPLATLHTGTARPRSHNTAALLQPDTALNDTYRIVRFIGEGGMGEVYEVSHSRLAGRYAAKVLSLDLATNQQAFSRFRREAQIASGLSHRNIVQVIDFSALEDGRPFLVMEFLDGHDLAQILSQGPLPLDRTMRLVEQMVSALSELHGHRIVHRDLKPQNIFVLPSKGGDREQVKLVDFGLAKRASPSMAVTRERSLLGTPQYMAPEQALGKADGLGPEADQFALAALVYEMLGGKPAFEGNALSTVLYRIVHEMPEPLHQLAPNLPKAVYAAVERGLAKAPEARFSSIQAFLHALQARAPAGAARCIRDQGASPPRPRGVRRRWLAALVVALVALGGGFWGIRMRAPTTSSPAPSTRLASARGQMTAALPVNRSGVSLDAAAVRASFDPRRPAGPQEPPAIGKAAAGAPTRARLPTRTRRRPRLSPRVPDSPPTVAPPPGPPRPGDDSPLDSPLIDTL